MSDEIKPDGWCAFRDGKLVIGAYSGVITTTREHWNRHEQRCEDGDMPIEVKPVCLIDPQELSRLRAVESKIASELKEHRERLDRGKGTWPQEDYIKDETWAYWKGQLSILERLSAITAPKGNPNKSDLLREEG